MTATPNEDKSQLFDINFIEDLVCWVRDNGKLVDEDLAEVSHCLPKLKDAHRRLLELFLKIAKPNHIEQAEYLLCQAEAYSFTLGARTCSSKSGAAFIRTETAKHAGRARTRKREEEAAAFGERKPLALLALDEAIKERGSLRRWGFSVTRDDAKKLCPPLNAILEKRGIEPVSVTRTLELMTELKRKKKSGL